MAAFIQNLGKFLGLSGVAYGSYRLYQNEQTKTTTVENLYKGLRFYSSAQDPAPAKGLGDRYLAAIQTIKCSGLQVQQCEQLKNNLSIELLAKLEKDRGSVDSQIARLDKIAKLNNLCSKANEHFCVFANRAYELGVRTEHQKELVDYFDAALIVANGSSELAQRIADDLGRETILFIQEGKGSAEQIAEKLNFSLEKKAAFVAELTAILKEDDSALLKR
jgi:hypothetical protein